VSKITVIQFDNEEVLLTFLFKESLFLNFVVVERFDEVNWKKIWRLE